MTKTQVAPIGESFKLADFIIYSEGSVISKTLLNKGVGTITLFSFDQGQGLSEHTSPYEAVVHILDGEASVFIDGKEQTVSSGNMLIMPANIPHSLQAKERFKMLLTMIREKK